LRAAAIAQARCDSPQILKITLLVWNDLAHLAVGDVVAGATLEIVPEEQ
jgi:hypothetical protein